MSLELWRENGWLREYKTSSQEVAGILDLVERDLEDAAREEISTDWRFNIAYNAGLQASQIGDVGRFLRLLRVRKSPGEV
jgi:hypothetical protein